ncbi:hypothetical protein RBB50_011483 [Rhinocladiella similis]
MEAFANRRFAERTYSSLHSTLEDPTELLLNPDNLLASLVAGDLDILSASRYSKGLLQPYEKREPNLRKKKVTSPGQLDGGVILSGAPDNSNHSSAAEQAHSSDQKKRRLSTGPSTKATSDQAESRKKRGRPRLDSQDETAADRRRTQIRLAQRAYRYRKETTIIALKQKVNDLQSTIEQMNQIYRNLHNNMVDAGIWCRATPLAPHTQNTTKELAQVSENAYPESYEDEENTAKITDDPKPLSEVNAIARGLPYNSIGGTHHRAMQGRRV